MAKKLLISYRDTCGLPRAYAFGPPDQRPEIERRASRELAAYIRKKAAVGEDCNEDDFTKHAEEVEG